MLWGLISLTLDPLSMLDTFFRCGLKEYFHRVTAPHTSPYLRLDSRSRSKSSKYISSDLRLTTAPLKPPLQPPASCANSTALQFYLSHYKIEALTRRERARVVTAGNVRNSLFFCLRPGTARKKQRLGSRLMVFIPSVASTTRRGRVAGCWLTPARGRSGTIHPNEIRTSISPSSAVEPNTTSALANYATEAEKVLRKYLPVYLPHPVILTMANQSVIPPPVRWDALFRPMQQQFGDPPSRRRLHHVTYLFDVTRVPLRCAYYVWDRGS
uniref:Uncharacterized protein n=1 Tax=Timema shepardi TaxID=629360 RepID=A0A7R9G0A7_TIMSH|nr:unnamed protein product [Timema shepardi]